MRSPGITTPEQRITTPEEQFKRMRLIASRNPSSAQEEVQDSSVKILEKTNIPPAQDTPKTDSENTPKPQTPLDELQQCGTKDSLKKALEKHGNIFVITVSWEEEGTDQIIDPSTLFLYLNSKERDYWHTNISWGISLKADKEKVNAAIRKAQQTTLWKILTRFRAPVKSTKRTVTITIKLAETK